MLLIWPQRPVSPTCFFFSLHFLFGISWIVASLMYQEEGESKNLNRDEGIYPQSHMNSQFLQLTKKNFALCEWEKSWILQKWREVAWSIYNWGSYPSGGQKWINENNIWDLKEINKTLTHLFQLWRNFNLAYSCLEAEQFPSKQLQWIKVICWQEKVDFISFIFEQIRQETVTNIEL